MTVTTTRRRRLGRSTTALWLATLSGAAMAQSFPPSVPTSSADDAHNGTQGQDIVVTAQKRAERLLDVPAAVTAITADTLVERQVNSIADIGRLSPSISSRGSITPEATDIRIRGVGTSVYSYGVEPSVSFVLDGVVQARQGSGFADLSDVERIEVLRGPQGTLFGKNATAGVINIVTARPSSVLTANAQATIAENNEYRVKASVSGPLADGLGARVSGYYNHLGGTIYDIPLDRRINGQESYGVRTKLEWAPSSTLNVLLIGDVAKSNAECCSLTYVQAVNPGLAQLLLPATASRNNRLSQSNRPNFSNTRQWQTSLEANLDLGPVRLTSITGYQDFRNYGGGDIDLLNTPRPVFLTAATGQFDFNDGGSHVRQFTQELRLANTGSGPFQYVVGAYYLHLDLDSSFFRRLGACVPGGANGALTVGQVCAAPIYRSSSLVAFNGTENYAAFGQVEAKLVGGLSAIGGIRVQHERNNYSGTRTSPAQAGDLLLNAPSSGSGSTSDTAVTGKAGLQYAIGRDAQVYGTWSRGYKGAAYAVQLAANFASQAPVRPETVDAWEGGLKFQTRDRTFALDLAVFDQRYDDLQVQANRSDLSANPPIINNVLTNAGSARTTGVEIEARLRPSRHFSVAAGATLLRARFDADGLNCPLQLQATAPVVTGTPPVNSCYRLSAGGATQQNIRDGRIPTAPSQRVTASARYENDVPGTGFAGFAEAAISFQSDYNFAIEQDPNQEQDGFATVDLNVGVTDRAQRYRLTLFVRNLFDQHYLATIGNAAVLTSATLTPGNLYGIVPRDANRYFGAQFAVRY